MKLLRFFTRISTRILLFNVLLVFLPILGFLYLDTYETQLLDALEDSMVQQGRIMAAALSDKDISAERAKQILLNLNRQQEARIRVLDDQANLLTDSSAIWNIENDRADRVALDEQYLENGQSISVDRLSSAFDGGVGGELEEGSIRSVQDDFLYQLASWPIRMYRNYFLPPNPPLVSDGFYSGKLVFDGLEVKRALSGEYGATIRFSTGGQVSMTLFSALPIFYEDEVKGVVLVSQSSYRILLDLYELRLRIFELFLIGVMVALAISLVSHFTVTRPLKNLTRQAQVMLDIHGRIQEPFRKFKKIDEIGDLSHSLNQLTVDLNDKISFIESFASDISHEMKNPLASIRSSAEMALTTEDDAKKGEFIQLIHDETKRLVNIISDVREMSRLETELQNWPKETILLRPYIENIVSQSIKRHRYSGEVITGFDSDDDIQIEINPQQIHRALENIISNAFSFTAKDGKVLVYAKKNEQFVDLLIADNGPGIGSSEKKKIFQRFYTFRPSSNGFEQHTGLGLSIARVIIKKHNGILKVMDNAFLVKSMEKSLNKIDAKEFVGAIFKISIPLNI